MLRNAVIRKGRQIFNDPYCFVSIFCLQHQRPSQIVSVLQFRVAVREHDCVDVVHAFSKSSEFARMQTNVAGKLLWVFFKRGPGPRCVKDAFEHKSDKRK